MKYKALLHETYTKRDINGNVYHVVEVTNPKNGKSFKTETPSMGNVTHILNELFPYSSGFGHNYYITGSCTGSTRLSSLPDHIYTACCDGDIRWKKALRSIGYRLPKDN